MFISRSTPMFLLLAACQSAPIKGQDSGWQSFSLGTMPQEYAPKGEKRYIVRVQRKFLRENLLPKPRMIDNHGRIIANNIRFGVEYPSLKPAEDAWAAGNIRVTIGNIVEDGLSSSVDGSELNYYSGYKRIMPNAYGLQVRQDIAPPQFIGHLYFALSQSLQVRIECKRNIHEADRWCVMDVRRPGQPFLSTGFYEAEMPHWRERWERLRTLFRSDGKMVLAAGHELS